jgi:hypothetical protein
MSWKNYLLVCVAVAVVVSISILFVPGLSDTIETRLLTFLSTNAR